jgi:hypothetical protein
MKCSRDELGRIVGTDDLHITALREDSEPRVRSVILQLTSGDTSIHEALAGTITETKGDLP